MKKLILTIAALLSMVTLSSCKNKVGEDAYCPMTGDNWASLCEHKNGIHDDIYYFYDKDTTIVYVYTSGGYHAAMSAYYNSKGEPMKLDEFNKVHMKPYHNTTI